MCVVCYDKILLFVMCFEVIYHCGLLCVGISVNIVVIVGYCIFMYKMLLEYILEKTNLENKLMAYTLYYCWRTL